jgi:hypothetical protein
MTARAHKLLAPALALALGAGAEACGRDHEWMGWGSHGEHTQGSAQVGGQIVSTVDGVAITVGEVQALVNATGLSPRAALTRLQSQVLLIGEAQRRGYARESDVEHVGRQALVQTLLERDAESLHASDAELQAAYDKQHARFHTPETRASIHVLAVPHDKTPEADAAAHKLADDACKAFAIEDDPNNVAEEFASRSTPEYTVRVERLPEVPNEGAFVEPFMKALFSTPDVGLVPEPVHTDYGWHCVYVTHVTRAHDTSLEEAKPVLRAELETELRRKKVTDLIAGLRSDVKVEENARGQKALGELEL